MAKTVAETPGLSRIGLPEEFCDVDMRATVADSTRLGKAEVIGTLGSGWHLGQSWMIHILKSGWHLSRARLVLRGVVMCVTALEALASRRIERYSCLHRYATTNSR